MLSPKGLKMTCLQIAGTCGRTFCTWSVVTMLEGILDSEGFGEMKRRKLIWINLNKGIG